MTPQTRQEIQRCQQRLEDPNEPDQAGALQGLEDWFCQGLFEDGLMTLCLECFEDLHSHCIGQGCECRCNVPEEVEDDLVETILDDLQENYEELGW